MGAALPVAMGLQVGGALMSAQAAKDQGETSANYYDMLGLNSDLNADLTEKAGERAALGVGAKAAQDSEALRLSVKKAEGTQDAVLAANGAAGGATAEDIARSTRANARLDELALRYNAELKTGEIRRQAGLDASNQRIQGSGYRAAGGNARRAGNTNSILSLVGGATQVATTAYASRR
jgi:hypothetical protein